MHQGGRHDKFMTESQTGLKLLVISGLCGSGEPVGVLCSPACNQPVEPQTFAPDPGGHADHGTDTRNTPGLAGWAHGHQGHSQRVLTSPKAHQAQTGKEHAGRLWRSADGRAGREAGQEHLSSPACSVQPRALPPGGRGLSGERGQQHPKVRCCRAGGSKPPPQKAQGMAENTPPAHSRQHCLAP